MSGLRLFEAGFVDLVSVVPPGAHLSPNSKLDPAMLGKAPGRLGPNGWHGYGWRTYTPTREDIARWSRDGANFGLLGRRFPAVDIDSDDPAIVALAARLAEEMLGPAPRRSGRVPRLLMPYRSEEPLPRRALAALRDGEKHLVEVLGDGRQYLVHGTHPSGRAYEWDTDLADVGPEGLTVVTLEDVERYLDGLAFALRRHGFEIERAGGKLSADSAVPQDSLLAPSIEDLSTLMASLRNPETWGWDQYVAVGYAVKAAGGEEAFPLWAEWSSRWEGGTADFDTDATNWQSFRPPFRVGWTWLRELVDSHPAPEVETRYTATTSAQDDFAAYVEDDPVFPLLSTLVARPELLEPPVAVLPVLAYRGRLTIFAGREKAGKSTLIAHGAAALSRGEPFLGYPLAGPGRTLWVGLEEATGDEVRWFSELHADHERIRVAYNPEGKSLLSSMATLLERWPADLVVIDSLQEYARRTTGKAPDDGDNAGWANVVRPLVEFVRAHDAAVVLLHHARRSDGEARGATEIQAAADAILEMYRPGKADDQDVRFINGRGRWYIEPFAVALRDGHYDRVGGFETDLEKHIIDAVTEKPGLSKSALYNLVGGRRAVTYETIARLLERGVLVNEGNEEVSRLHVGTATLDFMTEDFDHEQHGE